MESTRKHAGWGCLPILRFALSALLFAPLVGAGQIDTVAPVTGTFGTSMTLSGSGFGVKKGSLRLLPGGGGKARKLKITAWSDTSIVARLRKAHPGLHDLRVKPKLGDEVLLEDAFTVIPPIVSDVDPPVVAALDTVTIAGVHFGTKRPKVRFGGVKAKVLQWQDDTLVVRAPKKAAGAGALAVEVFNKVGATEVPGSVEVLAVGEDPEDPVEPKTSNVVTARVDGVLFSADHANEPEEIVVALGLTADPPLPGVAAVEALDTSVLGIFWRVFELQFAFGLDVTELPVSYTPEENPLVFEFRYREGVVGDLSRWEFGDDDWALRVLAQDGSVIQGEFEGTLHRIDGDGPDTIDVTNGTFQVQLDSGG